MKEINNSDNQKLIRVICTIIIMFVHMVDVVKDPNSPLLLFKDVGYLCVGAFFFFTGHNLIYSFKKNNGIKKGFIIDKIKKVFIPASIANLLFGLILCEYQGITMLIKWILLIDLANPTIWYINAVLLIYLIYYIVFSILSHNFKKADKDNGNITILIIVCSLIVFIVYYLITRTHYIQNNSRPLSLLVGMFMAIFNDKILNKIYHYKVLIGCSIFGLSILFHHLNMNGVIISCFISSNLYEYLAPLFFVTGIYIMLLNIRYNSKVINFISSISLEMYLLHYFFMWIVRARFYISNNLLFITIYIAMIIIGSYLLNRLKILIIMFIDNITTKVFNNR